jgi:glycine oxidase
VKTQEKRRCLKTNEQMFVSQELGGVTVEVRPQRGQLALLNPGSVALARTVFWSSGYLVPKPDGTVVVGSTEEDSGFDDRPTVAGIAPLLDFARRLVPGFGAAAIK